MSETIKVSLWELDEFLRSNGLELTGDIWRQDGEIHAQTREKMVVGSEDDNGRNTRIDSGSDTSSGAPGAARQAQSPPASDDSSRAAAVSQSRQQETIRS